MTLSDVRGVICDMDGVLWRGDEPLPGLVAFFDLLRRRHIPYILATNNSSKSPSDYVAKLARMGVEGVPESAMMSSGIATAAYLRERYPEGTRVHVLGGDGLRRALAGVGFVLADDAAQIVVVGLDWELNYAKLQRATYLIRAGALFVGTNRDATFPTPEGLSPGAGSIIAALATSTGQEPLIVGKPYLPMFEAAIRMLGLPAAQILMIGDRLDTDILGARHVGVKTALVLTGVSTLADVEHSETRPDAVYPDLQALIEALA